jgi:hypothetical protein
LIDRTQAGVRPAALQRGDRLAAWSVGLLLLAVYTATFTGLPDVPDAEVEFQSTHALARSGSLALGGTPEAEALIAAGFGVAPGGPARPGRWYARYGVGQAVGALPFYRAGSALARLLPELERRHAQDTAYGVPRSEYCAHLLVGWRNPLLGALTGFLIVLSARRLGVRRSAAWWCGLSYGLCTFAWPQARSTLSDVQATCLLFLAFLGTLAARESLASSRAPRPVLLMAIGAALAAAVLTRIAVLPVAVVLAIVAWRTLIVGHRSPTGVGSARGLPAGRPLPAQVLQLLLPFGAGLVALAALNQLRFGHVLRSGYEHGVDFATFFGYPPHRGVWALLTAPGRGLLWMAPGLLLVPLALWQARRSGERLWSRALTAIALAVILPPACMRGWHGAWSYGPRYLLPLLPFAWLGLGLALEWSRRRRLVSAAAAALCVLGSIVQVPAALVDSGTHLDLAMQAARTEWPTTPGVDEVEMDARRFEDIQWDWRFAAPWAHWRILRQRVAGRAEVFDARELFFLNESALLTPAQPRARGFGHLAWVDLRKRLGGPVWPGVLLCGLLWGLGSLVAGKAFARQP